MTEAAPILQVTGLPKSYGRTEALRSLSFEVYPGELVGLLGPNGAGKSTLFPIAAGLFAPDGGSVLVLRSLPTLAWCSSRAPSTST